MIGIRAGRSWRFLVFSVVALAVSVASSLTAPAGATPNFGGWVYKTSYSTYGGALNVRTPAIADETIGPNEIALARAAAQTPPGSSSVALVQAGLYRSGTNTRLDTCAASVNRYTLYFEYKKTTGTYTCGLVGSGQSEVAQPGADNHAEVIGYGDNSWAADVVRNNSSTGPYLDAIDLGFRSGQSYMGSENNNSSTTAMANGSSRRTCYGCGTYSGISSIDARWYVYTRPYPSTNFGGPRLVNSPSSVDRVQPTCTAWTVPAVPTPLTITHVPPGTFGPVFGAPSSTTSPVASSSSSDDAAARAGEAIPGARTSLVPGPAGGAVMKISTPPAALQRAAADTTAQEMSGAALAWRAQLAAGVAAARNSAITKVEIDPGATPTSSQAPFLRASLRHQPGDAVRTSYTRLGTVGEREIRRQVASNLKVLASALPEDSLRNTMVSIVPVDAAKQLFGVQIALHVGDLAQVRNHVGDIVDGLATGLTGDSTAVVEGLATTVTDDSGRQAGWWQADRAGVGMGVPGKALQDVTIRPVDREYPNLLGGPPPRTSVASEAISASTTMPAMP